MRLTIESTEYATTIDGVPCRIWTGRTESGHAVDVFIYRIASADEAALAELERELMEMDRPIELAPSEVEARRLRETIGEN